MYVAVNNGDSSCTVTIGFENYVVCLLEELQKYK